jgi:tetratricopeptide (TPR) repeat protein
MSMVKRFAALVVGMIAIAGIAAPAYGLSVKEARERAAREAKMSGPLGDQALTDKKYDEAIGHYTKVIDAKACGDNCGNYHYRRGLAYQGKQDCTNALVDFAKAAETLKTNGELYFNTSLCHSQMNQPDLALADLDMAIKVNPDSSIYRVGRCIILFNKQNYAGALPDCEFTLGSAPDDQKMLYATAVSAEMTGDKAKAAKYYRHLLTLDKGNKQAADGLARVGG